ncbi:transcription elongation factor SPT5-like isoform X2 [Tubulanus polymorphus]|uniref:transcription elongation factor SPT5-like isoform X2 n=1 Tax=Tubulanus polymorphus TaxID=672921 RepID=UPI003DA24C4B
MNDFLEEGDGGGRKSGSDGGSPATRRSAAAGDGSDADSDAGPSRRNPVISHDDEDAGSDDEESGRKRKNSFIDDEGDEEFREEDEDDEDERRRLKKRKKLADFILDEAEVDDEGEEEEDDWEEGAEEIIDRKSIIDSGPSARDIEGKRRLEQMWSQKEDEIEEYYRRKYAEVSTAERFGDGEEMSDQITQQGLLPGVKDPNLWVVKCRMGEEKATVLQIMRKYIAYQFTDEPLQIKSVVAKEGLKGYIYIEAYKQTHVKQAIEGIGNLRIGIWQQQMVPIKEMTDVLRVVREKAELKPKAWVRLKRGIFRDDLAQVDYVEPSQNMVHLKLIPRIDYTRMRGALRSSGDAERRKKKRRPGQKLFDVDAIRNIGGEVTTDGDFLIFEGNRFDRKGFLYKNFVMSAIIAEGVKPTLSELEKFEDQPEGIDVELVPESKSSTEVTHTFASGDMVEVCEGELIHLQGKVIRIEGNLITVMPKHEDLKDPIEFPSYELKKYFKMGDHVKVIGGTYEGDTGLIVRMLDNMAVVYSDLTMHEMKVLPRDLQLCSEMATGVDTMGQFQFGDLVQLDPQTVGVIVRLERENFQVLDMHGKVQTVKHNAVSKKRDTRNAVALDAENNNIQVKDVVKVEDGPHCARQGEIKHLYRHFAFLHSRMMTENGGVFVCKTRHVSLAGGSKQGTPSGGSGFTPMSPRISSPAHPGGGGGAGFGAGRGRGGPNRRDLEIINQTVRIVQGPFKGYIGIVKDATDSMARVELHTSCKTINVDKNRLAVLTGSKAGRPSSTWGGRTPVYGGQTPVYGSRTPMYGSATPLHDGSRTPHYGSQTPSHEPGSGSRTPGQSVWDPANPNTPSRVDDFNYNYDEPSPSPSPMDYGGATPNPHTPGYQPDTPSPSGRPYSPQTPGTAYSPYQPSPSPGGYQHTPSPGSGYGTPSPSGYQATPSPGGYSSPSPMGYSPMTPGAPFTPQTPGAGMEHSGGEWQTTDILVKIRETHDEPKLIFQQGVIRSVNGGMCSLYLAEESRVVNVASEHLEPVRPRAGDKVKVLFGEERESTGNLLSIDGAEGVVKTDQGNLKLLNLKNLCKVPNEK